MYRLQETKQAFWSWLPALIFGDSIKGEVIIAQLQRLLQNANQSWIENAAYQFHRLSLEIFAALLPFLLFLPFWRDRHCRALIDWIKSVVDSSQWSEDLRDVLEYPKIIYHCFGSFRISLRSVRRKWSLDVYICWISFLYTLNHLWLRLKGRKARNEGRPWCFWCCWREGSYPTAFLQW